VELLQGSTIFFFLSPNCLSGRRFGSILFFPLSCFFFPAMIDLSDVIPLQSLVCLSSSEFTPVMDVTQLPFFSTFSS
jgi:hypothetical protein